MPPSSHGLLHLPSNEATAHIEPAYLQQTPATPSLDPANESIAQQRRPTATPHLPEDSEPQAATPPADDSCSIPAAALVPPGTAIDCTDQPSTDQKAQPGLFLDLFAGVHCPLSNAVLQLGADCFSPFHFAMHDTHDILDDRVFNLLLQGRRQHSNTLQVSCHSARGCQHRRPGRHGTAPVRNVMAASRQRHVAPRVGSALQPRSSVLARHEFP